MLSKDEKSEPTMRSGSGAVGRTMLACAGAALAVILAIGVAGRLPSLIESDGPNAAAPAAALGPPIPADRLHATLDSEARKTFGHDAQGLEPSVFSATDGVGAALVAKDFDKASEATVTIAAVDQMFALSLRYAPSEFEGDKQENCENGLKMGIYLKCDVVSNEAGTFVSKIKAVFVDSTGGPSNTIASPSDDPDMGRAGFWYRHSVQRFDPSGQITSASEYVRANELAEAMGLFAVSEGDLVSLVSNAVLHLAEPPIGPCGYWVADTENVSCSRL